MTPWGEISPLGIIGLLLVIGGLFAVSTP